MLKEKTGPRNSWPLARISEVLTSHDGKIRKVNLRVASNNAVRMLTRSVHDTVLLIGAETQNRDDHSNTASRIDEAHVFSTGTHAVVRLTKITEDKETIPSRSCPPCPSSI